MRAVKRVRAAEIFPVISEILDRGGKAWITVTGMSMYPFLTEERDSVELAPASFSSIKRGDIVLIRRSAGTYILHRVLKKENNFFYIIGDAQQWVEGPLKPSQLIAKVTAVRRNGCNIECSNYLWRLSAGLWLHMIPLRHMVFKTMRFVIRISVNLKKLILRQLKPTGRNRENQV